MLADYWRYLARIRWQEEQLKQVLGHELIDRAAVSQNAFVRLASKLTGRQGPTRLMLGLAAAGTRAVVKAVFRSRIDRDYRRLGPISAEGRRILSQATRSQSAK